MSAAVLAGIASTVLFAGSTLLMLVRARRGSEERPADVASLLA